MTEENKHSTADYAFVGDDVVVPFTVEALDIRGRAVQLGDMLDTIIKRHEYPEDIGFLMGELVVLTVLLGTSLKFDGNFILQTQSDGVVSLSVVDFSTPGAVRAYVRFDTDALASAIEAGKASPRELLGDGVMAMTIDQGTNMQRYQGVVPLDGSTLEEVAHQYFKQSEQIPTHIRLSVAQIFSRDEESGEMRHGWRAGGVLAQFLPDNSSRIVTRDLPGGGEDDYTASEIGDDEAWVEASALMGTVTDDELSDPNISAERLLYRLFHEQGVRVFEGTPVESKCKCSREKVLALVKNFEDDPSEQGSSNEGFETKCEFCGKVYNISPDEL